MKAYAKDLSIIHDTGYGDHAVAAANYLLELLGDKEAAQIAELGCGSGLSTKILSDAGHLMVGIDISPAMIALARKRVRRRARFLVASFLDVAFPACDVVTAFGEVLNYRMDKANSRAALKKLCKQIFEALRPNGLFVFDLAEPGRGDRPPHHRLGTDWACLVEFSQDERRNRMTRHITTFRKTGKYYRRDDETHELQLYEAGEIVEMLRKIGFRVRVVRNYGDLEFPANLAGFVARKPR